MDAVVDLSQDLAQFAAGTRYRDLPPAAIEAAKKSILDTLGVILAASGMEPAVQPLIDLVRDNGGREEATVFGFGGRVPCGRQPLPMARWRIAWISTVRRLGVPMPTVPSFPRFWLLRS